MERQDNVSLNVLSAPRHRSEPAIPKERMIRRQPESAEVFVKRLVAQQVSVSGFLAAHVFAGVRSLRVVHRAEPPLRADQVAERRLDQVAETVGMEEVGV